VSIYFKLFENSHRKSHVCNFSYRLLAVLYNPLNVEVTPICHLLALLGAQHIFHVSGLKVTNVGRQA